MRGINIRHTHLKIQKCNFYVVFTNLTFTLCVNNVNHTVHIMKRISKSNVIEAAQIDLSIVQVKAPISTQKTTILYRSLVAVFHISLQ